MVEVHLKFFFWVSSNRFEGFKVQYLSVTRSLEQEQKAKLGETRAQLMAEIRTASKTTGDDIGKQIGKMDDKLREAVVSAEQTVNHS